MRGKTLAAIAILWAIMQVISLYFIKLEGLQMVAIHLIFALLISFLAKPAFSGRFTDRVNLWIDGVLCLLVLFTGVYFLSQYGRIQNHMPLVSEFTFADIVTGSVTILLTLEATRRVLGLPLTILGVISLLYLSLGSHLPGIFRSRSISLEEMVEYNYFTTNGLFGIALQTSATYVYIFVLFASLLEVSGLGPKFMDIVISFAGKWRGGPAKVAVLGSGLFGMITGSPSSNVAFTGSFTIPMMKRVGFKPAFAGAVEAVASSGGMVVPPLLGTAIFLIVQFTQAPITSIMLAAIVPAVLYFLALFLQVDLESGKNNIQPIPTEQLPRFLSAVRQGWHLLVPIAVIVVMLLAGYTPQLSALVAIVLAIPLSFLNRESRLTWKKVVEACVTTGKTMIIIATATGTAGLIMSAISFTGLEFKFSNFLVSAAGDNLFLLLLFTAVLSYILGMGLPVLPAYILVSLITAPILVDAGVHVVAAHLFVFFFAMVSLYTPPVAPCAFVAAGIAEAGPFTVGWESMKLGIGALIVPFVFIYHPSLLTMTPVAEFILNLIPVLLGIYAVSCASAGYMHQHLSIYERTGMLFCALILYLPMMAVQWVGVVLLVAYYWFSRRRAARMNQDAAISASS